VVKNFEPSKASKPRHPKEWSHLKSNAVRQRIEDQVAVLRDLAARYGLSGISVYPPSFNSSVIISILVRFMSASSKGSATVRWQLANNAAMKLLPKVRNFDLRSFLLSADIYGNAAAINDNIAQLGERAKGRSFYGGLSSRPADRRLEHSRKHGKLDWHIHMEFDNLSDGKNWSTRKQLT